MMEKTSSSPVAATPASMNTTPDKPKTASEHRKVCMKPILRGFLYAADLSENGINSNARNEKFNVILLSILSHQSQLWKRGEEPESTRVWAS